MARTTRQMINKEIRAEQYYNPTRPHRPSLSKFRLHILLKYTWKCLHDLPKEAKTLHTENYKISLRDLKRTK